MPLAYPHEPPRTSNSPPTTAAPCFNRSLPFTYPFYVGFPASLCGPRILWHGPRAIRQCLVAVFSCSTAGLENQTPQMATGLQPSRTGITMLQGGFNSLTVLAYEIQTLCYESGRDNSTVPVARMLAKTRKRCSYYILTVMNENLCSAWKLPKGCEKASSKRYHTK